MAGSEGLHVGSDVCLDTHVIYHLVVLVITHSGIPPELQRILPSSWIRSGGYATRHVHTPHSTSKVVPPPLSDMPLMPEVILFDTTITIITHPLVEFGNDRVDREW